MAPTDRVLDAVEIVEQQRVAVLVLAAQLLQACQKLRKHTDAHSAHGHHPSGRGVPPPQRDVRLKNELSSLNRWKRPRSELSSCSTMPVPALMCAPYSNRTRTRHKLNAPDGRPASV